MAARVALPSQPQRVRLLETCTTRSPVFLLTALSRWHMGLFLFWRCEATE